MLTLQACRLTCPNFNSQVSLSFSRLQCDNKVQNTYRLCISGSQNLYLVIVDLNAHFHFFLSSASAYTLYRILLVNE